MKSKAEGFGCLFLLICAVCIIYGIVQSCKDNQEEGRRQEVKRAEWQKEKDNPHFTKEDIQNMGKLPNGKTLYRMSIKTQMSVDRFDSKYDHFIYWTDDDNGTVTNNIL